MRSSRKQPEPAPPTFFLDRGLGKRHVAGVFTAAALSTVLMAEVFPDDGQQVSGDDWIHRASQEGWVALTKDTAIVRNHSDALMAST